MHWLRSSIPAIVLLAGLSHGCIIDPGSDADTGADTNSTNSTNSTNTSNGTSTTTDDTATHGLETSDSETGDGCNTAETTEVEGCAEIVGEGFCSEGGVHVEQDSEIEWSNNPPHSGDHYPTWAAWGEHDEPLLRGNWVHNMEHGGIVLAYNCPDGCDAELDVLREVITERPDLRILMTEDDQLDGPRFAAVSWTWVYEFDMPVLEELLCFADQHHNHAPEDVA